MFDPYRLVVTKCKSANAAATASIPAALSHRPRLSGDLVERTMHPSRLGCPEAAVAIHNLRTEKCTTALLIGCDSRTISQA